MLDKNMELGRVIYLEERKKRAYWLIAEALNEMKSEIVIPIYNAHELLEVYEALRYDFPEINVMWNYKESFYYENWGNGELQNIRVGLCYNGTRESVRDKLKKIDCEVERIIRECNKGKRMNNEQWIKEVYNYLTKRIKYSEPIDEGKYPSYAYTMECVLYGNGVCAGIAGLYAYILKKLGIPVMVISGLASGKGKRDNHAWNIVRLTDGSYRHIDVTWDVGRDHPKYLALDDVAMKARRHHWNVKGYPVCV